VWPVRIQRGEFRKNVQSPPPPPQPDPQELPELELQELPEPLHECPELQLLLSLCQGPDESFQLGPPGDEVPLSPTLLLYGEPYQGAPPVLRYRSADLDERDPITAISAISAPPAKHAPTTMRTVTESPP
jgi:hypothetical protein